MPDVIMKAWDATNEVWRKVLCDDNGQILINFSMAIEDVPTSGEHNKAPSSDWAYKHEHDTGGIALHYTDARAVNAMASRVLTLTTGTYHNLDVTNYSIIDCDTTSGNIIITGFAGGASHKIIIVRKIVWANAVTLNHDSSSSSSGNRIACSSESGFTLSNLGGGSCMIIYTSPYWWVDNFHTWSPSANFSNTPTSGVNNMAIDIDWAYDHQHDADGVAEHFTNAKALNAPYATKLEITAGTITNTNVAGKGMLWLNVTAGDIDLKGLAGGVEGQLIKCYKFGPNNLIIRNNSGDASAGNKMLTTDNTDQTCSAHERFMFDLFYENTYWNVSIPIDI